MRDNSAAVALRWHNPLPGGHLYTEASEMCLTAALCFVIRPVVFSGKGVPSVSNSEGCLCLGHLLNPVTTWKWDYSDDHFS